MTLSALPLITFIKLTHTICIQNINNDKKLKTTLNNKKNNYIIPSNKSSTQTLYL